MLNYPVTLLPDEETKSILVDFPDLPFCHSVGDDEAEALLNAQDAIEAAIEIYFEQRRPVPMPSAPQPDQPVVAVPALVSAKVLLWNEMLAQGVRKSELALRLGCQMPQVERLLNLRHHTRIEQIEAALARLDCRLEISVRRAA